MYGVAPDDSFRFWNVTRMRENVRLSSVRSCYSLCLFHIYVIEKKIKENEKLTHFPRDDVELGRSILNESRTGTQILQKISSS